MNVVMTASNRFVEVQGTAEGIAFTRDELDALLALAELGIAEIVAAQQEMVAEPARADAVMRVRRSRSCSRRATPTRRARSSRCSSMHSTSRSSPGRVTVGDRDRRFPRRRAGRDRGDGREHAGARRSARRRGDGRHARGERPHQGARRRGRARPAGDRRRHRARGRRARRRAGRLRGAVRRRGRDLRRQRREGARRARGVQPATATRAVRHRRVARWPDGARVVVRGEVEGHDRGDAARAAAGSATTRCSSRSKATAARSRR